MTKLTWNMTYRLICDRGLRITHAREFEDERLKQLIIELNSLNQREDQLIAEITEKGCNDSTKENQTKKDSSQESTI